MTYRVTHRNLPDDAAERVSAVAARLMAETSNRLDVLGVEPAMEDADHGSEPHN